MREALPYKLVDVRPGRTKRPLNKTSLERFTKSLYISMQMNIMWRISAKPPLWKLSYSTRKTPKLKIFTIKTVKSSNWDVHMQMWCKLSSIHSKRWTLLSLTFSQTLEPLAQLLIHLLAKLIKIMVPKCCKELWTFFKLSPQNAVKIIRFEAVNHFFHIVGLLIHLLVQVDVLRLVIRDLLQNLLQQLLWPSHPLFPKVCFKSLDLFGVDQGALEEREDKY